MKPIEGYVEVTGGRVYYSIYGKPGKTPILALQGGPGCPHDYLVALTPLGNERQIILYDQLGTGKSDRPSDDSLWSIDRYVQELGRVRAALGLHEIILYGHSWGTMLGTDYMLTQPKGVKALILSSPCLSARRWKDDTIQLRDQLPKEVLNTYERHETAGTTDSKEYKDAFDVFIKTFVCRIDPMPEIVADTFARTNWDIYNKMWGPSEWYVVGNLKNYERMEHLHRIPVPTLLLGGKFDQARPETLDLYVTQFPSAERFVFQNSSHLGMWEEPDLYLSTLKAYLQKQGI